MAKQLQFSKKVSIFNNTIEFPESPGVYKFYNDSEDIIYIGKAKILSNRLSSYLSSNKDDSRKLQRLKKSIKFVEFIITDTESDALLLEQSLIRKIKPPFNIQFRDDKSYPAIHISSKHEFPAIFMSRKKEKNTTKFGPFANVGAMKENINLVRSVFKIRNCKDLIFNNRSRPCIEYQLEKCSAPCVSEISKIEYAQEVKDANKFLSGETESVLKNLYDKMDKYSQNKDYERAILYREKIKSIRSIERKQNILSNFKNLDVISIKTNKIQTCISVIIVEDGWIQSSSNYYPEKNEPLSISDLFSAFLENYISMNLDRKKINILCNIKPSVDTQDFINSFRSNKVKILSKNSSNKALIELSESQAEDGLLRNRNFIWVEDSIKELSRRLELRSINRIEAFDISHTSGKEVSASCVVFDNSGPRKKDYRLMNIKENQNNDYAALGEAISRRIKNINSKKGKLPELIVIDGGRGQLNSVIKKLNKNVLNEVSFIAISKGPNRNEKYDFIHLTHSSKPIEINSNRSLAKLVQLIRNESHRFSLFHHRRRRKKSFMNSELDLIDGIGQKYSKRLIRHFGGILNLKQASISDLQKVNGIGPKKAKIIFESFMG
tara:strand:- start:1482 stop:3302 length:1821 start_codon:yes stop_codon:yes gene_type:complete